MPVENARVWRIKAAEGHGWVREFFMAEPLITADFDEAAQFSVAADARAALRLANTGRRITHVLVSGSATERVEHGDPNPPGA